MSCMSTIRRHLLISVVFSYSNIYGGRSGFRGGLGFGEDPETRKCHHCDKVGHIAKNCPTKNE